MSGFFFRGTFDPSTSVDKDDTQRINRRQLLKTIGVVGVGLTLFPKDLFGQSSCADVIAWRNTVNHLINTIADPRKALAMILRLNEADVLRDNSFRDIHEQYASPLVFRGASVENESVVCGNGFQVNQLPRYDVRNPCRTVNDLNAPEIHTITHPDVIAKVNCVLTPDGRRTEVNMSNSDHSRAYSRAASENGLDYREWHPPYRRPLRGRNRAHTGYLLIHKRQRINGYPKTKFIVSSDI